MIGIELVSDRETKERATAERDQIVQSCFHKGLLLLGCGKNSIRFCPPLCVTEEEVRIALDLLAQACTTAGE